ncbi:MAG: DEAD/DEAH box helicase family protein [Candidatus Delongbacteria bacterium]|nr:DEAD/DEAH box helicase family protein [Candidatus Delongbacteria bacterium]
MSTKFFTNSDERSLFSKFTGIIQNMKDLYAFHAVVGYFRSSGYFALQPYLKDVKEIRILVGINVDGMFAEAQRKGLLYFGDENKAKDEFMKWFIQDIKEAKYSEEVEKGILDFVNDIISGKIEVRAHNSKKIHAKFYLFLPEKHSEHSDGWVIMGSSNLTDAGMGIKKSPNYEMNIALKDFDDVEFTKEEFKNLWAQSTTILPADIQKFKDKTHIDRIFTPYELYLKFLMEYFGKNIDYDPDTVGDLPKTYKKLSYQVDAVNEGFQMLLDHNGFFLADVVGLGKTVVAAMIAKRFLIANGSLNTKILVIYPPAIEKNWKTTFKMFGIDKHAKFITNGRLDVIADNKSLDYWAKEDYDLILVDEAHRYRNHTSKMFENLQRICKAKRNGDGLVAGKDKKVILISATPLNNSPTDLYYQLLLFQDARRSTLAVNNLQTFFGPIIAEYKNILRSQEEKPDLDRIRKLYEIIREKIITNITVRRTRRDLKNYPKYFEDITAQGIIFPEIAVPRAVKYNMSAKLSKLFHHSLFYLTDNDKINYNRYQAIRYLNKDLREKYYEQAVLVSKSLAGIMKTLMVKRLESSFVAFRISLQNLAQSTQRMIDMFENKKILIAPDLKLNDLYEKGYSIEEIENIIIEMSIENPRNNIFEPDDFDPKFIEGLKKDNQLLNELIHDWSKVIEDPKLDAFFESFKGRFFDPEENVSGKLVIFTESKDTADYLEGKIEEELKTKVLNISSKNRKKLFETIQENFDANYIGSQKDDYKVLISTDVLAEGINLHRANIVINYDTPWNATRLMQRLGRVNRIGGISKMVYSYNFYPSQEGDEEIKLYKNALVKLQGFHSAFGEDAKIFTHEEMVEQFKLFKEGMKDDEDKRLLYLRLIREFKDTNPIEFKRIKQFPLKARTARIAKDAEKSFAADSTVVFLKSQYKTEFYIANGTSEVKPLTFIEAAEYFEAKSNEFGFELPKFHYDHVSAAFDTFEKDFLGTATETAASKDKSDAISAQAKKFLREHKGLISRKEVKQSCENLIELIENGTFTSLPNEIRKLKRKKDKKEITDGQVDNLILQYAKKFQVAVPESDETEIKAVNADVSPEIVISETFIG